MHSSSQILTTNTPTPNIYRPDALPVAQLMVSNQSTEGKYIAFYGLAYLKLTWGLPTLSLTTPWGRVAMPLSSPLMPVPHKRSVSVTFYFVLLSVCLVIFINSLFCLSNLNLTLIARGYLGEGCHASQQYVLKLNCRGKTNSLTRSKKN